MIDFEDVLKILEREYTSSNSEVLRFDLQYNGYHIFFLFRPSLVKGGEPLFIFNAYIDKNFICQVMEFDKNRLSTRIKNEVYFLFRKISTKNTVFFEDIKVKLIENRVNFHSSTNRDLKNSFSNLQNLFPDSEREKPFFWRLTTATMSKEIEDKLVVKYCLTKADLQFLRDIGKTAQFTDDLTKENNIILILEFCRKNPLQNYL